MSAGWFQDPSGRFSQRWFDGHAWSDQVVAANGSTTTDSLPPTDTPHPPPVRPTRQAMAPVPPRPSFGAPSPYPAPQPTAEVQAPVASRPGPGLTLGLALLGVLLLAASLLGVPWADSVSFFDISDGARNVSLGDEPVIWLYGGFLAFLCLVCAAVLSVLAGTPVPRSDRAASTWRILTSAGCAVAAVLHAVTTARIFRGPVDPGVGAWLGLIGYFVIILAMVIGHYSRKR